MRRCWGSRFFERESNHGVMGMMRLGGKLGVAVSIHAQIRMASVVKSVSCTRIPHDTLVFLESVISGSYSSTVYSLSVFYIASKVFS